MTALRTGPDSEPTCMCGHRESDHDGNGDCIVCSCSVFVEGEEEELRSRCSRIARGLMGMGWLWIIWAWLGWTVFEPGGRMQFGTWRWWEQGVMYVILTAILIEGALPSLVTAFTGRDAKRWIEKFTDKLDDL